MGPHLLCMASSSCQPRLVPLVRLLSPAHTQSHNELSECFHLPLYVGKTPASSLAPSAMELSGVPEFSPTSYLNSLLSMAVNLPVVSRKDSSQAV